MRPPATTFGCDRQRPDRGHGLPGFGQARSPKDTEEKAGSSRTGAKTTGKKPAAKKRATTASGTSRSQSLRSLAKAELYGKATRAGIRGRSGMSHDELADALAADSS